MHYLNYRDFIKGESSENYDILVAQTKKSFLIGPKIDKKFDAKSFCLRINSNCIYNEKIYNKKIKKINIKKIEKYWNNIGSNEVYELFANKHIIHKILKVPGEDYETK